MKNLRIVGAAFLAAGLTFFQATASAQVVTTLAGSGASGSADGNGVEASFSGPSGLAVDLSGNVYVADTGNNKIRKITPSGAVTTLAGSGNRGGADGRGTAASFRFPTSVAVDLSGNVYVTEQSYWAYGAGSDADIRRITPDGEVTTVAARISVVRFAAGVTVDNAGNLYVADGGDVIGSGFGKVLKITPDGRVTTLAEDSTTYPVSNPWGIAADGLGHLYVTDWGTGYLLKLIPGGPGTVLAKNLDIPAGVAVDSPGNVYVAESRSHRIRKVGADGTVTTVAGSGIAGNSDGTGTAASFNYPTGVALDSLGNLYVAESGGHRIRKISLQEGSPDAGGWTSRGLEGRAIGSLVVDPRDPSRIYAAAGLDGVYRTDDGGENWSRVDLGRFVEKLAIDAQAPDMLYAVAGLVSSRSQRPVIGQRLFRTLDRGNTWAPVELEAPVYSVAVHPGKPGLLYAGRSNATVSTSRDGGSTWSASAFPYYCSDFCDEAITSLALDPSSPSTIYAGIDADFDYPGFDELFKSTDGGATWKASDAGLVLWSSVYAIAVDPGDPKRVLAGTSAGTYLSQDSGSTWSATSGAPSRAFAFDPRNPSVVYAGTDYEGVLRSTDRGAHWSPMNVGLPELRVLSLAFNGTAGLLLAATRGGVFTYSVAEPRDQFIDLFDGVDGATGFLMIGAGRTFRLGTVDGSGQKALRSAYGPYPGWTPGAGARGPDGGTRVLWNNDDGSAALWLTRPEGVQASFLYPARPGWAARDVAAGADGSTHLLRAADDGAVSLWTVDRSGVQTNSFDYGPYSDWSAVAIADGTDGRTRLLWTKSDGTAGLSFFDSSGMLDSHRYGPGDGWKAVDLAVDNDNQTRILRAHEDGRVALWTVDADGQAVSFGTLYPPPPGFQAARISTGSDGLTRLLWRDPNGLAIVWLLSANGLYQSSFPLN